MNRQRLYATLGYSFADVELVKLALTHKSVGKINNERLEFLGDSLLNLFIAKALFLKFPTAKEGELSRLRAELVKGETLAKLAREMSLGDHLLLGGGELKSGGFRRESILADAVEALIGAIFIDSDMDQCEQRVLAWYDERLSKISLDLADKDPKSQLQEYMQERKKQLPVYRVVDETGPSHERRYTIECQFQGEDKVFSATAGSKRSAEKLAAVEALKFLGVLKHV